LQKLASREKGFSHRSSPCSPSEDESYTPAAVLSS
jgi:hypothetical protein